MDLPLFDSNDRYIEWVTHLPQPHFEALHHAVLHRLRTSPPNKPPSPGISPPALPSTLVQALTECASPIVDPHEGAHAEEIAPIIPCYSLVSTGEAVHSTALYRAAIQQFRWLGEVTGKVSADSAQLHVFGSSSDAFVRMLGEIKAPRQTVRGQARPRWVNRLPGMAEACRKAVMHRAFSRCSLFRKFPFVPEAWVLPAEMDACAAALRADDGWCIVKPAVPFTSGTAEIWMANSWQQISEKMFADGVDSSKQELVQRYVERPLLLTGCRKFHITMFTLVGHCQKHWQLFVCNEGLVTACATAYCQPTGGNMNCQMSSRSRGRNPTTEALSLLLPQIAIAAGLEQEQLKARLRAACSEALSCVTPNLHAAWHRAGQHSGHEIEANAYHIVGVDLLLSQQGEPILLEVNANPSMTMYDPTCTTIPVEEPSEAEIAVKLAVLQGTLEIILGLGHSTLYEPMPLVRMGVWDQLSRVFCRLIGSTKEITGPMFRKLTQQSGAATSLVSDEVFRKVSAALNDRKFGVVQGSPPGVMCSTGGGSRYKGVGVEIFFELITELVRQQHGDKPIADALEFVCELFEAME